MTSMRGNIRSGNSGGPVVDAAGRVVATVFAATTRGPHGGFGIPSGIVESGLLGADRSVGTGPCAR
jgi:S1-C subfamily serine protease